MTSAPLLDTTPEVHVPTTRRYVMCPPRHFAVRYAINPWMDPGATVDRDRALAEWHELKNTYQRLGHRVEVVEPQPGLPDMVFAANSGTVIDGRVLGARFRAPERAPEAEHYRRWFTEHGYRDVVMPAEINEAEGDFVWTSSVLLAGAGFRTDPAAHLEASEALRVPVVGLRLVDPRYYHLDTALFVLDADRVCYYPDAFSPGSRAVLRRMFPNAIRADAADAECLGLNAISDGYHVVLPSEATALGARLAEYGYQPVYVDVSELRKAGGGPKCCTMELRAA